MCTTKRLAEAIKAWLVGCLTIYLEYTTMQLWVKETTDREIEEAKEEPQKEWEITKCKSK